MNERPGFPSVYEQIKRVDHTAAVVFEVLFAIAVGAAVVSFAVGSTAIRILVGIAGLVAAFAGLVVVPDVVLGQRETTLERYLLARQRATQGGALVLFVLILVALVLGEALVVAPHDRTAQVVFICVLAVAIAGSCWGQRDELWPREIRGYRKPTLEKPSEERDKPHDEPPATS